MVTGFIEHLLSTSHYSKGFTGNTSYISLNNSITIIQYHIRKMKQREMNIWSSSHN